MGCSCSAIAGIAFANAFLGINHSLSHKLGGWFHIPHGTANALLFPFVCRFNAQRHPYKMGTFSQYKYPQAFERYVELGELIGVNFDRTWLSTMSDIAFDPAFCRNIALDIRYVLFVIDRIGDASYLFEEMDFAE